MRGDRMSNKNSVNLRIKLFLKGPLFIILGLYWVYFRTAPENKLLAMSLYLVIVVAVFIIWVRSREIKLITKNV